MHDKALTQHILSFREEERQTKNEGKWLTDVPPVSVLQCIPPQSQLFRRRPTNDPLSQDDHVMLLLFRSFIHPTLMEREV